MREQENALQAASLALQGLATGMFLVLLLPLNIGISAFQFSLLFLPVAAIFFWPVGASHSWSLVAVFVLGLFTDLISYGQLGIWPFSYLLLFIILGQGVARDIGLAKAWVYFALCLIFIAATSAVLIKFSAGYWLSVNSLMQGIVATLLVFPFIYGMRRMFIEVAAQREERKNF